MTEKIAVLVDSCCDIPEEYLQKSRVYELPVQIIYRDKTYVDRVDITPEEVYQRLPDEIPKTSLPSGETISNTLDKIYADDYSTVISISLSSNLSGTFGFVSSLLEDDDRFIYQAFDTKDVAVGAGLVAVYAKDLIDEGLSFEDVGQKVDAVIKEGKSYFCIPTLKYLRAGGRIGLLSSMIGGVLNLAPIITCNDEGLFVAAGKARGMKRGQKMILKYVKKYTKDHKRYLLAVAHGADETEGGHLMAALEEEKVHGTKEFFGQVGPALGVHTGPGLVGVAVLPLD